MSVYYLLPKCLVEMPLQSCNTVTARCHYQIEMTVNS